MKKTFTTNRGFTLIETLVAIAILMVAIAGPLNIANKGLVTAVNSRNQTVASYLAEDVMEYVKNVRDYNILTNPTDPSKWLTNLDDGVIQCISSDPCIVETATGDVSAPTIGNDLHCTFAGTPVVLSSGCQLYLNPTAGYYTYSSTGNQPTQFYRSFSITPLVTNASALLTVSVYWTSGTLLNSVVLQSVIFDTHR